jgi:hypothetical protein
VPDIDAGNLRPAGTHAGTPVPALTNLIWPSRNVPLGITMIVFVAG